MPRCGSLLAALALLLAQGSPRVLAQVGENQGLLNPNLAAREALAGVPGISDAAARAIMEGRPFASPAALHSTLAEDLGDQAARELYQYLWLPMDLNDASADEIQLIPGVGSRMRGEFEEYRPYDGLAVFHREIGKYVDDEELARLAQYVYVRIDLNGASREEILSIPGVGPRMAEEFEEYRPYDSLDQFRVEIGKYVDEGEVARLERYVEIR